MLTEHVPFLRCPLSGEHVRYHGDRLVTESGRYQYPLTATGIPQFAGALLTPEARQQQAHYDGMADTYLNNLTYPHTQAYMDYLDRALLRATGDADLGRVLEVCCGRGEVFHLIGPRVRQGFGVDVSLVMLEAARTTLPNDRFMFIQADATKMPLTDASFDTVFTLGGIHHVNDRPKLFSEVFRILRPGGRFIWREPLNDFALWRLLRFLIYRISPLLDSETEHPIRYGDTVPVLEAAGFRLRTWRPCGFLGFCLFMNSDVLVFNRLLRFIPGVRGLVRLAARLDEWLLAVPGLRQGGLQVIGVAEKPAAG